MVVVGPAGGFGLCTVAFVVFIAGSFVTYGVLKVLAKIVERHEDSKRRAGYWDSRSRSRWRELTEGENLEKLSLIGGGVAVALAVALAVLLLPNVPKEWLGTLLGGLTVLGFLVSILSFLIAGLNAASKPSTRSRPTSRWTRWRPTGKRQAQQGEHQTRAREAQRRQRETEKARQAQQTEYQAQMREMQRRLAEHQAIKDGLYSLFGMPDGPSQKRAKELQDVMTRLFRVHDLPVREAFELVEQKGGGLECIGGVVEIDERLYLVEVEWRAKPLGTREVAPHLVRVFNRGYSGGILLSKSGFAPPATATCREALSQKTVVLCELEEVVTLLERNGSLKSLLQAKIVAAAVDKNPLLRPSI
ncbi:MAG: hypothetical protein KKB13_01785 [Chloroflexi bacterium]|nr:hypothetical protein [Chloroflexota bacterium]